MTREAPVQIQTSAPRYHTHKFKLRRESTVQIRMPAPSDPHTHKTGVQTRTPTPRDPHTQKLRFKSRCPHHESHTHTTKPTGVRDRFSLRHGLVSYSRLPDLLLASQSCAVSSLSLSGMARTKLESYYAPASRLLVHVGRPDLGQAMC